MAGVAAGVVSVALSEDAGGVSAVSPMDLKATKAPTRITIRIGTTWRKFMNLLSRIAATKARIRFSQRSLLYF